MWVAKISFDSEKIKIGKSSINTKVNFYLFPISWVYTKKYIRVNFAGSIEGEAKDKKEFIKSIRKTKGIFYLEESGDFLVGSAKEPLWSKPIYSQEIIFLEPALITQTGTETIVIGAFEKKHIDKFMRAMEKIRQIKIHYIQKKKINSISIIKTNPNLTEKQKRAMDLALKHGYYKSPRKISVKELAKIAEKSFSTFQVHLRKAEEKLMPNFFE